MSETNGHGDIGYLADAVETFPFRLAPGKAPLECKVYPYRITLQELEEIDREVARAQNVSEQIKELERGESKLETELLLSDDAARIAEIIERREAIKAKLEELRTQPTAPEIIADRLFVRVFHSWPLKINDEPVPISVDGVQKMSNLMVAELRVQLTNFLSVENRQKRRV